jgi:two-component system sensor histidine kinase MprB
VSFRARLVVLATGAVSIVLIAAALIVYAVVRNELEGRIDEALRQEIDRAVGVQFWLGGSSPGEFGRVPPPAFGGPGGYLQLVTATGSTYRSDFDSPSLPVTQAVERAAIAGGNPFFFDTSVDNVHLRVLTEPLPDGYALEATQPLTDLDNELASIRRWLVVLVGGGIAAALGLGFAVARAALAPVRRLTTTTEHVSRTQDLASRIEVHSTDELGKLASSFNVMLEALDRAAQSQRRLVADASHELRTPLTSLRTNIEVLALEGRPLDVDDRRRLLTDVVHQVDEMNTLIGQLVDLARPDAEAEPMQPLRLDHLTAHVIERARRQRPSVPINADLEETLVHGAADALERAVTNLIDNAAKWTRPGTAIVVRLAKGELSIRDRGPGIAPDDLPHIFESFYRSVEARSLPGSGLGLAIVKQVVDQHHGTIAADRPFGGGTRMTLRLPLVTGPA